MVSESLPAPLVPRLATSEAAAAALDFALGTFGADRVNACMSRSNLASARVATKIGMQFQGETDFYGESSWLYVRWGNVVKGPMG